MTTVSATPENTSFKQRLFRTRPEDVLPLSIQHQRIYILPTRRGLAYLFSLLIMLIASVNYALSLGYALCFLLTGLFAASLLHTYRNVAGITCNKISSTDTFAGDIARFSITLKNNTTLDRLGVTVKTADASDVVDITSDEQAQATLTKATTHRGTCKLGRITITSTYPLGLWRTWCYIHSGEAAIVYPAPEKSPPPMPSQAIDSQGENVHKANQGDIAGVREYHAGDSISSIAWKAAARGQGLFVKTFEDENASGETHFNKELTGLQEVEQQLSRLCAWVLVADKSQTDYSFELDDTLLELGRSLSHKQRALTALAKHGIVE